MSRETEEEKFYNAVEETSRMMGVPFDRDKVRPLLTGYRGAFAEGNGIVFSVHADERHAGELNYAITVPPEIEDPYAHAVSHGFVVETGHPTATLLSDVRAQASVAEHFCDCGVVGGFRKLYAHFPHDLQEVAKLAEIPSMPRSLADNVGLFTRYGMEKVAMIGVNYRQRHVSVYFQFTPDTRPEPDAVRAMLREVGLPDPDEKLLDFAHRTLRANITLGYESSDVLRVALAPPPRRGLDLSEVPARIEPHIERFATGIPRTYSGDRVNLFAVKWAPEGEFLEVCSYYQLSAMLQKLFVEDPE
ncbi:aromatic prenyltransferase Orf2 [Actinomadura hallensis]|uniref:Aromatic prenyltransferase Orf2 n=1 Tax=Actinomadura hallensis TaxID=337895 RepID=A0A543IMS4_9ACTN|nr:aromatic prenyltransferase [Actinomadura hallensis]TQM71883.1 aromatic prenyltransferase Orf2 [Actinomadura hallensis]